ncbi:MAG: hypothetical protein GC165_14635 [Armatimonadetes bacterium]|nr:hypothetical protein [Armatimonadota bacterium]
MNKENSKGGIKNIMVANGLVLILIKCNQDPGRGSIASMVCDSAYAVVVEYAKQTGKLSCWKDILNFHWKPDTPAYRSVQTIKKNAEVVVIHMNPKLQGKRWSSISDKDRLFKLFLPNGEYLMYMQKNGIAGGPYFDKLGSGSGGQ